MKTPLKLAIVAALTVTVVAAVVLKQKESKAPAETNAATVAAGTNAPAQNTGDPSAPATNVKLPKLLDLGAGKCIPCKMMAPILELESAEFVSGGQAASRALSRFNSVWRSAIFTERSTQRSTS